MIRSNIAAGAVGAMMLLTGCAKATVEPTLGTASLTCPDQTRSYDLLPSLTVWNHKINAEFKPIPCTLDITPIENATCEMQVSFASDSLAGEPEIHTAHKQIGPPAQFLINSELFRGTYEKPRDLLNIAILCSVTNPSPENLRISDQSSSLPPNYEMGRQFIASQITGSEQLEGILRQVSDELNGDSSVENRRGISIPGKVKILIDPSRKMIIGLVVHTRQSSNKYVEASFGIEYDQNNNPIIAGALIEEFHKVETQKPPTWVTSRREIANFTDVAYLQAVQYSSQASSRRSQS